MPKRNVPWIDGPLIYHRIYDLSRRPLGRRPLFVSAEALLFHPVVGDQKLRKVYHGGFFAHLATRLKELEKACQAQGAVSWRRGLLIRHIEPHGVMTREIPPWFEPAETLIFAAACIKGGRVKFCPPTIDKMAIHPLGAALNFKADDRVEAALQGAFLAAISLKFDHQLSSKPRRSA